MGIDDEDHGRIWGLPRQWTADGASKTRATVDCVLLLRLAQVPAAVRLSAHPLEGVWNALGAGDLASAWLDLITNCTDDPNKGLRNA